MLLKIPKNLPKKSIPILKYKKILLIKGMMITFGIYRMIFLIKKPLNQKNPYINLRKAKSQVKDDQKVFPKVTKAKDLEESIIL